MPLTEEEFEAKFREDLEKFKLLSTGEQILVIFELLRNLDHDTAKAVYALENHVHNTDSPFCIGSDEVTGKPRFVRDSWGD